MTARNLSSSKSSVKSPGKAAAKSCQLKKELLAEFLGTYLFLMIGIGCVAALTLAGASYSQWEVSLIWGLGVALGVYVAGTLSGAHLNPTVTLALALFRDFPKSKILPFIIIQFLAAFAASASIYILYYNLFAVKDLTTAGIFTTFPHHDLGFGQAFLVEFLISAILVFGIFTFSQEGNEAAATISPAILVGLLVAAIGASFGPLTGFAMNAARDFGPRLFIYFMGWGPEVFTANLIVPYFMVPLIAPICGGLAGGFFYQITLKNSFRKNI